MKALVVAALLVVAGASQLSCNINNYCLNCEKGGDGGNDGNGGGDGAGSDGGGGSGDGGICIPTGPEICDGKDNDCNGLIDDNPVDANVPCMNQMGACAGGVTVCSAGVLKCSKNPSPEVCDGIDNDCNGLVDEGDPGGGGFCGNGAGDCMKGVNHCIGGQIQCFGGVGPTTEVCDGRDNDCDGIIDEGLQNLGQCGTSNIGICHFGTQMCQGGTTVCVGAQGPLFEVCNGLDDDCNGIIDDGYDLQTDPRNCGACNHICNLPHANAGCANGQCVIASCQAGYHDNDGNIANGCEFGPCFTSGVEVCDGVDNDCDGSVDEDLGAPPAICLTQGECAGATAQCMGAAGWVCDYNSNVSTDGMGNIIPETKCDGLDNDCNGIIDDHQPQTDGGGTRTAQACDDGKLGACKSTGHFVCDSTNLNGPAVCDYTTLGASPQPESCNNTDDDCDGIIDNPSAVGTFAGGGLEWIDIGGGHQMMKFEASKPDGTAGNQGSVATTSCGGPSTIAASGGASEVGTTATFTTTTAHGLAAGKVVAISGVTVAGYNGTYEVIDATSPTQFTVTLASSGLAASGRGTVQPVCPTCAVAGRLPWTDVTYPQAVAACQAVGATLCSEQQWHRACSVITPSTYPIALAATGTVTQLIEAEDYFAIAPAVDTVGGSSHAWVEDYTPGFSGISALQAIPDTTVHGGCSNNNGIPCYQNSDCGGTHTCNNPAPVVGAVIANGVILTDAPHVDYKLNFGKATSSYRVWVLMYAPNLDGNKVAISVDGSVVGANQVVTSGTTNTWQWERPTNSFTITSGVHTVSVYMQSDGVRIDAIEITDGAATPALPADPAGNEWAYAANANTYQPTTCNGHDLDPAQDATVATGSLASCYANDALLTGGTANAHAFDMSGNVKEWVLAHQAGENPIRGGASNDTDVGTSCPLNFTLADDKFFFLNVGFRCCR